MRRNVFRYGGDDAISKRNSNRSQRFSRYRNRDRFRQDRHTLERERVVERYPKRFVLFHAKAYYIEKKTNN